MKARWVPSVAAATVPAENPPEAPPAPRLTLPLSHASTEPVVRAVELLPAGEAWLPVSTYSMSRFSSFAFLASW